MTVLSRPNHPLRLAWLFGATLAACAVVAAAAVALIYMVRDQQGAYSGSVAAAVVEPRLSDLKLPAGLIAVHVVKDAKEFQQLAGWKPFIPAQLPTGTQHDLALAVSFPDDHGARTGRIGYSPRNDYSVGGITGPMVVIMEAKGTPGAGVDGTLKRVTTGSGRTLAATLGCAGLVLDVQLYFGPKPAPDEPFITPYMTDIAERFLAGVRGQCGG